MGLCCEGKYAASLTSPVIHLGGLLSHDNHGTEGARNSLQQQQPAGGRQNTCCIETAGYDLAPGERVNDTPIQEPGMPPRLVDKKDSLAFWEWKILEFSQGLRLFPLLVSAAVCCLLHNINHVFDR